MGAKQSETVFPSGRIDGAIETLGMLDRKRIPVQVEIEKSPVGFSTRVVLRNHGVVLGKPLTLRTELHRGGYVQIQWPGTGPCQLRLQIALPHFNLPGGNVGFICKLPEGRATHKRKHSRFDASPFNNLALSIGLNRYQVLDLSTGGCRIALNAHAGNAEFGVGRRLYTVALHIGTQAPILVDRMVPRSLAQGTLGCEFELRKDATSSTRLAHILKALELHQLQRAV